ncbi:putative GTP cyclohydrolase 1 [Streptomyces afghaniensis 772]|uniref:GTP cyclohydrolase 1 n=1 Tax=Streptomyces afghaniensis 772 TaxID=1283301 RepID=S4MFS9_9ACTN|nr:putative GTP cyclohydrolase 1 [Streptomyces afghaniensis 772]UOB14845.1 GTP cyclohydrolase I [Streptomyces sp. HP-A2021]
MRLFARRFSVQERIGRQLAESLQQILLPHGVAVHLGAVHLCTQMRGVREIESSTQLRGEFFTLCGQRGLAGHG